VKIRDPHQAAVAFLMINDDTDINPIKQCKEKSSLLLLSPQPTTTQKMAILFNLAELPLNLPPKNVLKSPVIAPLMYQ